MLKKEGWTDLEWLDNHWFGYLYSYSNQKLRIQINSIYDLYHCIKLLKEITDSKSVFLYNEYHNSNWSLFASHNYETNNLYYQCNINYVAGTKDIVLDFDEIYGGEDNPFRLAWFNTREEPLPTGKKIYKELDIKVYNGKSNTLTKAITLAYYNYKYDLNYDVLL